MSDLFAAGGVWPLMSLVLLIVGLGLTFTVGKKRGHAPATACCFGAAAFSNGVAGFAIGTRMLGSYIASLPASDMPKWASAYSKGFSEAAMQLALGSIVALILFVVAGVLAATSKPSP